MACVGVLGLPPAASAQLSDAGGWSITPYLWGTDTVVDLSFRETDLGAGEITFDDLLDVLDAAFMVHVEGGSGNWSAFGDLTYLKTSETTDRSPITVEADSEQIFLDAVAAYWPGGVGSALSFFGGLRYSSFDDLYRFSSGGSEIAARRSDDDYFDVLLGVRYRFDLNTRWSLLTRADYSFGDSEDTYLLRANFAYALGQRQQNRILFGYQYKRAEFASGDLVADFTYGGPMAGFNFRF